jgi:hypothetical protein
VARKGRERERFDERGKAGAFGWCRSGGDEKDGGTLFVVRALRKSIEGSRGLTKSDLAGVGGDSEASDSEEEDSSDVSSSSDSVGWPEIPLEGIGGAVGEGIGLGLNESDQNDDGRCSGTCISNFLGVNHGIQALLPGERPSWGAR